MPTPPTQQQWPIPGVSYVAGYGTKNLADFFVYRYLNSDTITSRPKPPEYGEAHPDTVKFPEHILSLIKPDDSVGVGWMLLVYTKDLTDQDSYNFEVSAPYGPARFPRIERTYIMRRDDWLRDGPLALGTADPQLDVEGNPVFPDSTLIESDQLTEQTGDPRIDSIYVRVKRVFEHIPDLSDEDDAAEAHGFGYRIETPFGLTAWPRITWRIPNTSQAFGTPLSDICPIIGFTAGTFGLTSTLTGVSTHGTTSLTVASTGGRYAGGLVTGTDIPAGTTIVSIDSTTTLTLSQAATGSHSGLTMTVGYFVKLLDQSYENEKGQIVALTRIYEPVYGPLIPESDLDQQTFTAVRITKQIVAQSAVPATAALLTAEMIAAGDGVSIEYKPMGMDGLRSVRIVSSADVADLDWMLHQDGSKDIHTLGTYEYSWPDSLRDLTWYHAYVADGDSIAADVALEAQIEQGYRGPCPASFFERYTSNPTDTAFLAALPKVTLFSPQAITAIAILAKAGGGRAIANERTFTIPATIHPAASINVAIPASAAEWIYYTPSISATVPPVVPTDGDTYIVAAVKHERYNHRLWKFTIIYVAYPKPVPP